MKKSQKIDLIFENVKVTARYEYISPKLHPLIEKLEREGDLYGPAVMVIDEMCVQAQYHNKHRGPIMKIFGHNADEFMAKQHK